MPGSRGPSGTLLGSRFSACFFSALFGHLAALLAPLGRFCVILDGFWVPFWLHFGILLHTFDIIFLNLVFASFLDAFFMDFGTPATSKTMLLLQ